MSHSVLIQKKKRLNIKVRFIYENIFKYYFFQLGSCCITSTFPTKINSSLARVKVVFKLCNYRLNALILFTNKTFGQFKKPMPLVLRTNVTNMTRRSLPWKRSTV